MSNFLDEDREESVIERRDRERGENTRVENEEGIPLIPNVKLDVRKTIHAIHVWKMDPPGDGFKGTVPPHTTYSTIAKLYGNGVYDFHACTQDEKILRRNAGVKISWAPPEIDAPEDDAPTHSGADMQLLRWQAEQHAKDSARVESFGRMVVDTTRATAEQQITAITKNQEATQSRDRDFFAGILAQQQQFFASMMAMTAQAHAMTTERSREDFRQTIQVLQMSHERESKANDPTLLLGLFREGLALGAGNDSDDDETEVPWVEAIKAAGGAIKDITGAANIRALAVPKTPAASAARPVIENPAPAPATSTKPNKKKPPFTREELAEVLRFKRIMDQKGMDFSQTVRNASQYFAEGEAIDENAPEGETDPPPDSVALDDSASAPATDLEG